MEYSDISIETSYNIGISNAQPYRQMCSWWQDNQNALRNRTHTITFRTANKTD